MADNQKYLDNTGLQYFWQKIKTNFITGVQKNGTDIPLDSNGKVNISIPTTTSDLTNNSGFVSLGETSSTAYRGDYGKLAYNHSEGGTSTGHHTLSRDSSSNVYKIDNSYIAAKFDGNADEISTTYYKKSSTGIPKTDLASAVQTSLDHAETAYSALDGLEALLATL